MTVVVDGKPSDVGTVVHAESIVAKFCVARGLKPDSEGVGVALDTFEEVFELSQ